MNEQPDWATVLEWMYSRGRGYIEGPPQDPDDVKGGPVLLLGDATLIEATELTNDELDDAVSYLLHTGLIEETTVDPGYTHYQMTEKGFRVAHERVMQRREQTLEDERADRQTDANLAIGWLTVALVVVSAVDAAINAIGLNHPLWGRALIVAGLALATGTVLVLLGRTGLLEP
jgi:hypothetical protein